MSLADELLADLDDIGDELGNDENDQVIMLPQLLARTSCAVRYFDCKTMYCYSRCSACAVVLMYRWGCFHPSLLVFCNVKRSVSKYITLYRYV